MTIRDEYFDWIYDLVGGMDYSPRVSYRKLLSYLHDIEFTYSIDMDGNRAEDGVSLRRRFSIYNYHMLNGPCSILEMMVALAIRCEENIMDDPTMGDRTGQWFWGMIINLGLGCMTDDQYDEEYIESVVRRFLNREYEPDGRGGLFRVRRCEYDLRNVEIWDQLGWYLNSIT